jgi:hypothetical protein
VVNELYEPVSLLHLAQGRRDTDAGRRLQSRRLRDRVDVTVLGGDQFSIVLDTGCNLLKPVRFLTDVGNSGLLP